MNYKISFFLVEFFAVISSTIDKQLFFENVQQQKISILKINDKQKTKLKDRQKDRKTERQKDRTVLILCQLSVQTNFLSLFTQKSG